MSFDRVVPTPLNTRERSTANLTSAPIEPGASGSCPNSNERTATAALLPEFGRVPDVERLFGVKRGLCYRLIGSGAFRSVCLRKHGAATGVRLIQLSSVRDWLLARLEGREDSK